jgi:hypothetical protein
MFRRHHVFNLQKSFNLKSIEISISFIYPVTLVNSVTFCFQTSAYIVYTKYAEQMTLVNGFLLFNLVDFGRIFANFLVIGFLCFLSWSRRRKIGQAVMTSQDASDLYFRQFQIVIS